MQSLYETHNARERALKSPPSWINIPEFLHVARVARDLADSLAGGICYSKSGLNKLEAAEIEPTILDELSETSGPPLPPTSMMSKWRVFAPLRLYHCFGGKGDNSSILFSLRLKLINCKACKYDLV